MTDFSGWAPPAHRARPPAADASGWALPAATLAGAGADTQRYPPPPLRAVDKVWRYGLASLEMVFALGMVIVLRFLPEAVIEPQERPGWWHIAGMAVAFAVGMWIIRYRRRRPVAVVAVLSVMGAVVGVPTVLSAWAMISLCTRRRWREVWIASGIFLACASASVLFQRSSWMGVRFSDSVLLDVLLMVVTEVGTLVLYAVIGFYIGARRDLNASLRDRADSADRYAELSATQALLTERQRIAREMHDVLAHRISLVSMHAAALNFRQDLTPEETREIAHTIQTNAQASLNELRTMLGSLREDAGVALPQLAKPQPLLPDLTALLDEARAGGSRVDFDNEVSEPDRIPTHISRHAFRIIQEGLTNARKHAPAARITVRLSGAPGEGLSLAVSNPLTRVTAEHPVLPGAGLGLVGVRERAQVVGGHAESGITAEGEFQLTAWLPW